MISIISCRIISTGIPTREAAIPMTVSHPHTAEKTIITLMIRISLTMEAGIVLIPHLRTAIILSDERYTPKDTDVYKRQVSQEGGSQKFTSQNREAVAYVFPFPSSVSIPVSYTHLDVYKRQLPVCPLHIGKLQLCIHFISQNFV